MSAIEAFVPSQSFTAFAVAVAIPDICCNKFRAVLSPFKRSVVFPLNSAIRSPFFTLSPSCIYTLAVKESSKSSKTLIATSMPQRTPSAFETKYASSRCSSDIR